MVKIKKRSKKLLIISAVAAAIMIVGGIFYLSSRHHTKQANPTVSQEGVNYAPPTKEDAQRVDDTKQKIVDQQNGTAQTPTQTTGKKAVIPTITYAAQYQENVEVSAYVEVFENGGLCTATFSFGNVSFTKSVAAVENVNKVNCPVMSASSSTFSPKGTWSVVVTYNSATSTGSSTPKQFEVK